MLLGTVNAELKMEPENANLRYNETQLVEELNDEFREKILPVTIFVGVEVFLGFFGNLLVLYVFSFHYHVCNFRYFVLCLALTDLTSTLTTMPGEMVTHMFWYIYPFKEICKVKSFFNMFTVVAEALCLLTIAVDRYRKVCRPFGRQMKPKGARVICVLIYIVAVIFAMPVPFFWGLNFKQKMYIGVNVTTTVCATDAAYSDTKHPLQYSITMETILSVCVVAMFVLYIFVARTLMATKMLKPELGSFMRVKPKIADGSSSGVADIKERSGHSDTGYSSNIESDNRKTNRSSNKRRVENDIEVLNEQTNDTSETDLPAPAKGTHNVLTLQMNNLLTEGPLDDGLDTDESRGVTTDEDSGKHRRANSKITNRFQGKPRRSKKKCFKTSRTKRKTFIMIVLTVIFMVTVILYLTLLSFIAKPNGILDSMSHTERAFYFLFFRFYFINHVINPFIYGLLDPHFRKVIWKKET